MRIEILGPFWISVNVNKHPYSSCDNPHIGFFWTKQTWTEGAKGLTIHFPKRWPIWNLDRQSFQFLEKYRQNKKAKLSQFGIISLIKINTLGFIFHRFLVLKKGDKILRTYWSLPFMHTRMFERKL